MLLFVVAFITQFVGHKIGDYFIQSNWQSINKPKNIVARLKHVAIYSTSIFLLVLLMFNIKIAVIVFVLTFIEHIIIDSRTPVVWWKNFFEKKICRNKDFKIKDLPFFVLIEIDQTVHIMRIFVLSLLIGLGLL